MAIADRSSAAGELATRLGVELGPELDVQKALGWGERAGVFLARERSLQRPVVVKVLRPEVQGYRVAHLRFEREARAVASLAHPNVVTVYRYGRLSDATPYLVMQYVKGRSLAERLAAEGPLPPDEARRLLADVARALAAAHAHHIVHRNVRPSKVLYDQETDRALLTDFGIAAVLEPDGVTGEASHLTSTGQILGDPRYMSPEWLEHHDVTPAADIYSLGVLAYELLTGEEPFGELSPVRMVVAHLEAEPRPLAWLRPDVDPDLDLVLRRCLARNPAHRPDAAHLVTALTRSTDPALVGGPGATAALLPGLAALFRRRIPQYLLAAGAVGWICLQVVDQLVQQGVLPGTAYGLSLVTVLFWIAGVGVVAWFHGAPGQQKRTVVEIAVLIALGLAWLAVGAAILS